MTARRGGNSGPYALTILMSAFLIFQVQPLISKYILPWFGGTPGVWTTCMLFFQVVLFAGYAYAHASIRWLTPRWQAIVHTALLLLALSALPITPDASWKPTGGELPTGRILGLLAATVGLPYFLLSATGPLLQGWFSQGRPGNAVYRLYALSNIGSVMGLVTYPFLFEPWMATGSQAAVWSGAFVAFTVCCGLCALDMVRQHREGEAPAEPSSLPGGLQRSGSAGASPSQEEEPAPKWSTRMAWFGLSACASVMLLATTNQVCLDVAVIPFLWVLPLTLYLASFILCFDRAWWYPRRTYAIALVGTLVCLAQLMRAASDVPILTQITVHFASLFFCCMVCHGELVRLKPSPQFLTSFYLASSAGGAAGGILVGVIAPLVFHQYLELHAAVIACCLIAAWLFLNDPEWLQAGGKPRWIWGCVLLAVFGGLQTFGAAQGTGGPGELAITRNFYGVLRIVATDADKPTVAMNRMVHGRIVHGMQFTALEKRTIPTAYYGEHSGVGLLLNHPQLTGPRKVGMVGLGVGTLAAYGRDGDVFRFYEINPDVIRLAEEHFSYMKDSAATIEMVVGDARLSLEREADQQFDVLVLDAFSSDSIPAHLLTEEAFAIYLRHLKPNGALAFHITNRHFDLQPVIAGAAERYGLHAVKIHSDNRPERAQARCDWMLLSRDPDVFTTPDIATAVTPTDALQPQLWTDRFNNVVSILK